MVDDFLYKKENIKEFVLNAMLNARKMFRILTSDKAVNEHALYGYHSIAYSSYLTAKSYYLQNEELSHSEFDLFFAKFERFSLEFTSSRATNHSMQWTFIYYDELLEAFNELAALLGIKSFSSPE